MQKIDSKLKVPDENGGEDDISLKKEKKHFLDNQKRLLSVKQRQSAIKSQQKAIENALTNLDSNPVNKKVVFDSDNESDGGDKLANKHDEHNSAASNKKDFNLFEQDEELEEESEKFTEMFRDKVQFHGTAGKKLFELQSKIGDPRFRLDERFIETNDEQNNDVDEPEDVVDAEKSRNLSILGDLFQTGPKPQESSKRKFAQMIRYDERKSDHVKYEKRKEESSKRIKLQDEDPETNKIPKVSPKKFFEVDPKLSEALRKQDPEPSFSLLKMFDDVHGNEGTSIPVDQGNYEVRPISFKKEPRFSGNRKDMFNSKNDSKFGKRMPIHHSQPFFFTDEDPRFAEGSAFFQKKDVEVDVEKWKEIREALFQTAKKNYKSAVKKSVGPKRKLGDKRSFKKRM